MSEAEFLSILQQTLWLVILVSAPVMLTSMVVGIGISIFQAVTQIQESTLTFVPKILISLFVFVLTAPWVVDLLVNHTQKLFNDLNRYTH